MGSAKWTDEQLAAITGRNCNLLVSAAAGAGKTAVLVERIIRKITCTDNPIDIDRLLVVTFTKAAAAEMRERIGAALVRELNENPDSVHLNRQVVLLTRATITTLHSFCMEVLKKYFFLIGLDPAFRVAEESEATLLQLEAMEMVFEEKYDSGDEGFLGLVEAYGGERDDLQLQEMALKLYNFAVSNPWPEKWLAQLADIYELNPALPLDHRDWVRSLQKWIHLQLCGCREKICQAIKEAASPGGPGDYLANLNEDLLMVDDLIRGADCSWEVLGEAFASMSFGKLKQCRDKSVDELLKVRTKKLREEVKKTLGSLQREFFARGTSDLREDLEKVRPHVSYVGSLVRTFMEKYQEMKRVRGLVDFSDLEHYCLQILTAPTGDNEPTVLSGAAGVSSKAAGAFPGVAEVAEGARPSEAALELRQFFEEVLVDEYQDTNAVQETILSLVSRQDSIGGEPPNRFMVGDVKQSIYRFRLAEPTLFMSKYESYPRTAGLPQLAVDLTKNFRSRRDVVEAVNFIFRQLMTPGAGEIKYDDKAELVSGALYPQPMGHNPVGGPVELYLMEKDEENEPAHSDQEGEEADDPPAEDIKDIDAIGREARFVARRIKELVFGTETAPGAQLRVFDKAINDYRWVEFRDIVILLRTTRGAANTYMEELKGAGIPVYADLGTGYFAAIEIETMLSLLKVIDNPSQDIPLAALLRSPVVSLGDEELAEIRLAAPQPGSSFYEALQASALNDDLAEETRLKVIKFLSELEEWRTTARRGGSLPQLIWQLYNETGYYTYVGAMPSGTQRQANLRALYDRARQYEATAYRGLFRFLRFIERFQDMGNDLGTARALGENENVVRIMSIHKSKGLEFPVVIVAGLGREFNCMDLRRQVVLHKQLGLGLPVVDTDLRVTYPCLVQTAIKKKLHAELLAEEMRVLYVALTRAREKLILTGAVRGIDRAASRWCEHLDQQDWELPDVYLTNAKSFLDWICPAVARHRHGQVIRGLGGYDVMPGGLPSEDPSEWSIKLLRLADCSVLVEESPLDNEAVVDKLRQGQDIDMTSDQQAEILTRLGWQHPWKSLAGRASKVAVTELKKILFETDVIEENAINTPLLPSLQHIYRNIGADRPRFMQRKTGLSAAEKGSAMHLVLQHLDLKGDLSARGVESQVKKFCLAELVNQEQASVIDSEAIARLFRGPLGERILNAQEVLREVPFTLAVPAFQVYPELPGDCSESVLVQGVIDCLVKEEDGYVLIDYKTDRVSLDSSEVPGEEAVAQEMANKYAGQLKLYALAVEQILRCVVKERILYLLTTGSAVKV